MILDEDPAEAEAGGSGLSDAVVRAVGAELAGVDLAELVTGTARKVVRKQVEAIAAEAIEAALTPERLEDLRERTTDAIEAEISGATAAPAPAELPPAPVAGPELLFGSTDQWTREWLLPVYRRYMAPNGNDSGAWCPHWWRHPEAILRLEALWRAWEKLRQDGGTGMSMWWRDHADHHLPILLASTGPFRGCSIYRGHQPTSTILPAVEPDPGLFPDERPLPPPAAGPSAAPHPVKDER